MEKKSKMPKVVMAVSVAAMGMGLFGALQNEARATGGGKGVCCKKLDSSCPHPTGGLFADSIWVDDASTCTGHN